MQLKCPCLYIMLTGGSELRVRFDGMAVCPGCIPAFRIVTAEATAPLPYQLGNWKLIVIILLVF